jgi:sugar-specific transcriptional regulator TrmB
MANPIEKNIDIHNFLYNLGFEKKEVEVYLKLLEVGSSTMAKLARKTGIPKTTLYRIINKLQEKSMVSKTQKNEVKLLTAETPERFSVILEEMQTEAKSNLNELDELSDNLPEVIKSVLESVKSEASENPPLVKYYEGIEGFRAVTNRSLEKAKHEVLQISNCNEWRKVFTKEYSMENYVPLRIKKKLGLRALVVDNRPGNEFKNQGSSVDRSTRFLPKDVVFKPTILIYDGEVSIMVSSRPYSAVLLQSYDIYEMVKALFELAWTVSKE